MNVIGLKKEVYRHDSGFGSGEEVLAAGNADMALEQL